MNLSWGLLAQIALAVVAGLAVAYQPGMNAKFAEAAPHRIYGGVQSFFIGFAVLAIIALFIRTPPMQVHKISALPWWSWLGGTLGAFFVMTAIFLVPKMGTTVYVACMLAGQLIGSIIIDHFGHMGLAQHPFTPGRALGILLLVAGIACIKFL